MPQTQDAGPRTWSAILGGRRETIDEDSSKKLSMILSDYPKGLTATSSKKS